MGSREPVEPDLRVELVDDGRQRIATAHLEAGRQQVTAVRGKPSRGSPQLEDAGELVEVAAEGAAGAGGVLQQDWTPLGLASASFRASPTAASDSS